MSVTDEQPHVPTEQETAIYQALTAGDQDTIDQLEEDAENADQTLPTSRPGDGGEVPEGWLPPAEQFDVDYDYAHAHYQADNEMPEAEREQNTAEQTQDHNQVAEDAEAARQEMEA